MVVISNLLDSMCSCLSDQACGGAPRYGFAAAPPPSSSEDVQMAEAPATASGPSPTTDGRQSSSGSPTGSLQSNRSSSPRSSPSPSHFLKFRGASGTEWQSLVRRTSCGAAASAGSSTSRPSSPSIQDNNSTVMRCLDMDNAQMALAHARQQVGARAHNNHHKRKASSDIFRSRHDAEASASAESSSSSDEPMQQRQQEVSSERVASPVPLGGLCAPNLNGVDDNGPLGVRSLLRFPGLCFANPIRGSSSFEDTVNEKSSSTIDEADRPASPAYLLEKELADKQRQPERPMPLYASQQVAPLADTGIDNGPICLTDMIRQANNASGGDGGAKKMRLTAPSAPATTDAKPSFAFSSSSDEEEEDASVESTPATMTEGAEGEAPITPTALEAYGAIGASTNANTNTASPPSTNVQSASAPTHQITPNFTPSTSRPHKQPRMKSPGAALNGGGIQALGSGPSVPELMFASTGPTEEAPVTPGQVPMSAPPGATENVPVTPEKPYFDV